jgi:hypothetical protein
LSRKHDRRAAIELGTVDGGRALAFATTFYQQMLAGTGLGDAVKNARSDASMTWAAYQCYGDPEFRLRTTL